ncbi:RND superfamily putative drug exporter [Paenibacillus shirakamiensis]|uniref:RND superfamily putative drug exporter n=1 Tax=Paenibacillus shirakamiensis TaxID=1265935 RepID=A0ABS4JHJ1_9BACL|nr:MMPL family transporter [Paenibacillus shirakamiensis]MBP2001192.1 RND superfamily putative drug exporter [Paenibacillus shirakamiensis]
MRFILKTRWLVMLVWVIVAVGLMLAAPSMTDLVREKGNVSVPDGYSSSEASVILKELAEMKGGGKESQVALVFHQDEAISTAGKQSIQQGIEKLNANKAKLGIDSITDPFSTPDAAEKMISKDGRTILTAIAVNTDQRPVKDIAADIRSSLSSVTVKHYLSGQELINEDNVTSSEQGLKKSEYFTVIFILLILFLMFRSFVAPFIPLLTVGFSYIVSQSIVAFLVDSVNFPLSTYTQIFMVAIMFGIGTDYCILLISRFKEELQHTDDTWEAIVATYRTAGKTVFFSGLAVLVGFSAIGLSKFILYKSAVAVAIGIAVMLVALVTIVPFFMAVLGKKIFWPAKGSLEHKENKLWGAAGSFAIKRPWAAMLVVVICTVPFLITYSGKVSFNSMEEIGEKYESVKAFNIISESFEPGEALPTSIVIKNTERMDNAEYMALAEKISREVSQVDGVSSVRGLSRPTGDEVEDFQLNKQVQTVGEGLGKGNDGLNTIKEGLSKASNSLSENEPKLKEAADSTGKLAAGTEKLKNGISQLSGGLSTIESGIRSGSAGAGQLKQGLSQAKKSAQQLATAQQQLLDSYQKIGKGVGSISGGLSGVNKQLAGIAAGLNGLSTRFTSLESKYPELAKDQDYLTIRGTVTETGKGTEQISAGLKQLQTSLAQASSGLTQANRGLGKVASGQTAFAGGFDQLIAGITKLESGLTQAADGQGQIVGKIPAVVSGLAQIQSGQEQVQNGFNQFSGQISKLTDGLSQSADGIAKVSGGLDTAKNYLTQVGESKTGLSGFYVPAEALNNKDVTKLFDTYLSKDRKIMTLNVVFSDNPYGTKAISEVDQVKAAVSRAVEGTKLSKANIAFGGVTSTFNDLKNISDADYSRTVVLMLAGIFIILVLLFRSIIMPLYLIASLVLTFYTSLGITELIFVKIMGISGISWATPFFGFVILIALGIDYSIFLMDRFNENKHWSATDAILHAMRNMGTVILSAAVILGGTFASMYPSGVMSMLQIATVVLSGLALYSLVILPFFIPVMVKTFGNANWWPFPRKAGTKTGTDSTHLHG